MWRLLMGRSKVCYLSVPSRALVLSQHVATRVTRWSPGQSFAINSTNCLPSPTPILKRHFVRCFVSKVSMNNNYYLCGSCGSGASEWDVSQGLPVISRDQQKIMFNVRGNAGYHSRMVTFLSLFIYKKTPTKQAFSAHKHILLLMHKREMKMQDNDKEKKRKSREKERRREKKVKRRTKKKNQRKL